MLKAEPMMMLKRMINNFPLCAISFLNSRNAVPLAFWARSALISPSRPFAVVSQVSFSIFMLMPIPPR